ncbi:tyrosine-type recombinase/integrase [Lentzea sp. NPDC102401]|uniref:tyrosine-type recombinase/integrase n=1 Tax=Lentzea sp. NPDC102401 TaxID=3364128 RepID=UPI00381EB426
MADEMHGGDAAAVCLPRWGAVVPYQGSVTWVVVDPAGVVVEPIRRFLADFVARGRSASSIRSYAYALLRWWRWLAFAGVSWNRATSAQVRDFVLWLSQAVKPRRHRRTKTLLSAGTVNPITRKRNLGDGYEPRTIRHSNAVLRSFYDFWCDAADGVLVNPVPLAKGGAHAYAHRSPLEPALPVGRLRYNPPVPRRRPRSIPDQRWNELFARLRSNRDRALLAMSVSNGCRASELLGVASSDVDWGEQRVRVCRKGSGAEQWLPVSPDGLVWLMLYLADLGEPLAPDEPLWWTVRRRDRGDGRRRQPLNYEALRAVMRRVNAGLGTNWSMHDVRHTCALRMAQDKTLSLRDVQSILGHQHLSTTAEIYLVEHDDEVIRRVLTHLAERQLRPAAPAPAAGYDSGVLDVLFGGGTS